MESIDIKVIKDFIANIAVSIVSITFIYLFIVGIFRVRKEIRNNRKNYE